MTERISITLNEMEIFNLIDALTHFGRLTGAEISATNTGIGTYIQVAVHSLDEEDVIGVDITDYDCW